VATHRFLETAVRTKHWHAPHTMSVTEVTSAAAPKFRITGTRSNFYHDTRAKASISMDILGSSHDLPAHEMILVQKTLCKDFKSKARKALLSLKSSILDVELPLLCSSCCASKLHRTSDDACALKCACCHGS
jgi:hypothetical protein